MMNCTDFQDQIGDYCSGALSSEPKANCEAHLASCSECAKAVDSHNSFLVMLKAMPVPDPSEGFAKRALQIAVESEIMGQNVGHHHRRGFMVGFGSAVAAVLALWVVVGMDLQPIPGNSGTVEVAKVETVETKKAKESNPEFSIALNEQRDIKLAFYSSEELKGATITLQMPEAITLVGYEGQRKLVWKTNLAKGDNTLRLPIIATSAATGASGGQLVAHIEYKGKVRTLKVNLAIGEIRGAPDLSDSTGLELRVV